MQETSFADHGLAILMYHPTIVVGTSYVAEGTFMGRLSEEISSWSHEIRADGGYWSAEFSFAGSRADIDDWLSSGVGRHIVCRDRDGEIVWAGFVDKFSINIGPLAVERGPLMDVANRVENWYTPIIDATTDPPVTGDAMPTPIVEWEASQQRWGIIEKILNSGQMMSETAAQISMQYIIENHNLKTSKELSLGNAGAISFTVTCLGYVHWLDAYAYNNVASPTTITVSDKIEAVLAADVNHIIAADYDNIDFNGTLVTSYEGSSRTAKTIIDEISKLGGGSDDRWIFGIYAEQRAFFQTIPTEYTYRYSLLNQEQQIIDYNTPELVVEPWRVKAGKWLYYDDFIIGRLHDLTLGFDPRSQFIESVTFSTPNTLSIKGDKVSKLAQKLARLGLGGI